MMKVLVDYPTDEEEFVIVERVTGPAVARHARWPPPSSWPRCSANAGASTSTRRWCSTRCRLVSATRTPEKHGLKDLGKYITFGASPRATINLTEGARALAMLRGRTYALPEDMTDLVPDVLRHRAGAVVRGAVRRAVGRRAGGQDHGQDPVAAQAAGT